uniref:Secreted protein n=1 Tax=Setaria italica TaxID=4555 RepID=K3XNW4_SETIT
MTEIMVASAWFFLCKLFFWLSGGTLTEIMAARKCMSCLRLMHGSNKLLVHVYCNPFLARLRTKISVFVIWSSNLLQFQI